MFLDEMCIPYLVVLDIFAGYIYLLIRGILLDALLFARGLFRKKPATHTIQRGGPPLLSGWVDFYVRRLYRRIEDCWNIPIRGEPGAHIDVLMRSRNGDETTEMVCTGEVRRCLNLGSYNYLGFGGVDQFCTPAAVKALEQYGVSSGSSRMEAGITPLHIQLELKVADFLGKPAALVIPMGFGTNAATIPALIDRDGNGKGVLIISDALNHSSIVEGVRSAGAKVRPFRHNDLAHLEKRLQEAMAEGTWRKVLVVVEGVYSMEGEYCPLPEIVALKKKYKAYLYLDEAHSIGAIGGTGRGITEHFGVDTADVDVMMGTFSKSFGSVGGYIASSEAVILQLKSNCAGAIYASAMAPACVQQVITAFDILQGKVGDGIGAIKLRRLRENANFFRHGLQKMGAKVLGDANSPVVPMMLFHPEKISAFSRQCLARNVAAVVVGYPATPLLLSRARFCVSAAHSRADLIHALHTIADVSEQVGVLYNKNLVPVSLQTDQKKKAPLKEEAEAKEEKLQLAINAWKPEPLAVRKKDSEEPYHLQRHDGMLDLRHFDFFGFSKHPEVLQAATKSLQTNGCGSCGPRGFFGTVDVHLQLEKQIADFLGTEQCILYSHVMATVSSVIPAFAQKTDVIFCDEHINYNVQQGVHASRAIVHSFKHNDMDHLGKLLSKQSLEDTRSSEWLYNTDHVGFNSSDPTGLARKRRYFLVVEGLYQNTGRICPLPELLTLKQRFGCYLIVDESISFGTLGKTGRGLAEHHGVATTEIDMLVGSVEHALGAVSGFCAGTKTIVSHQRLSGKGYCFSAASPPFTAAAACAALSVLESTPQRLAKLQEVSIAVQQQFLSQSRIMELPVVLEGDIMSPIKHLRLLRPTENGWNKQEQLTWMHKLASKMHSQHDIAVQVAHYSCLDRQKLPASIRICINHSLSIEQVPQLVSNLCQCVEQQVHLLPARDKLYDNPEKSNEELEKKAQLPRQVSSVKRDNQQDTYQGGSPFLYIIWLPDYLISRAMWGSKVLFFRIQALRLPLQNLVLPVMRLLRRFF